MFDDTALRLMRLSAPGYCCSQVMILIALEDMGRDNPDLVRAAAGLCHGLGDCQGPCGVFTGGAALIALYTAKGQDTDENHDKLPLLLSEFSDWFSNHADKQFGGTTCVDIMGTDCGKPDPERCGGLLATAYDHIQELFAEHDIDPSQGKDDARA